MDGFTSSSLVKMQNWCRPCLLYNQWSASCLYGLCDAVDHVGKCSCWRDKTYDTTSAVCWHCCMWCKSDERSCTATEKHSLNLVTFYACFLLVTKNFLVKVQLSNAAIFSWRLTARILEKRENARHWNKTNQNMSLLLSLLDQLV